MLAYVIAPKVTWPQAMGLVVWEGVIITILVLTGFRKAVFKAVPRSLRTGISVGIGLFIALIGLVDAGVVRKGTGTPVELGISGSLQGWPIAIFLITLAILIVLFVRRVKGAMLIAILSGTVLAVIVESVLHIGSYNQGENPTGWMLNVPAFTQFSPPNLGLIGKVDLFGGFAAAGGFSAALGLVLLVFSLLLADFFDTMGTVVAVGAEGDLLDESGNPPRTQEILLVDSVGGDRGWRRVGIVQHVLHRIGRRRRRGRTHRGGIVGHRRRLPAERVPGPAGQHGAVRGCGAGAVLRRLPR